MAQRTAPVVPVDQRQYLLDAVEFDILWEDWCGRTPTPLVLRIASAGRTHRERQALRTAVGAALSERGVLTGSGPDPELAGLFRLLGCAFEQLELRVRGDTTVRAVAAAGDGGAVFALRQANRVLLTSCDSLPSALLAALPGTGPGPGRASALPTATLAAALRAPEPVAALIGHGVPASEARLLERLLRRPDRQAQVVALRRDRHGELQRVGGVLGIIDGPRGRYLLSRSPAPDGTEWSTLAPVDSRRLRHRVAALLPPLPHRPACVNSSGSTASALTASGPTTSGLTASLHDAARSATSDLGRPPPLPRRRPR